MTLVYGNVNDASARLVKWLADGQAKLRQSLDVKGLLTGIKQKKALSKRTKAYQNLTAVQEAPLIQAVELFAAIDKPAKDAHTLRETLCKIFKEEGRNRYIGETCDIVREEGVREGLDMEALKKHLGAKYAEFVKEVPVTKWVVVPK